MQTDIPTLFIEMNDESYVLIACVYEEQENFKIIEKIIVPNRGVDENKLINLEEAEITIKENVKIIENKLDCIFKDVTIIIDNFDYSCINISGFKKLNGSQVLKENISYILNSIKLAVSENEKDKTILHIFNSKSVLDGTYVKNLPIGLFGDFYSHELTFFLINNNNLKNIKQIFKKNDLNVKKILLKNYIQGVQLINQNDDIESFFKIKIKKDSSNIIFFDEGSFRYVEYFKFGTSIILKDIAKICSLDYEVVERILSDESFKKKNYENNEFLEEKYFSKGNYRKIRKKLIKDIANARILEITNIILNKNININPFKKNNTKVYVIIDDELILNNFSEDFKSFFSKTYNLDLNFTKDLKVDTLIETAANLSLYGWKKEAIPITQTKNSLIARIFKSFFD